MKKLVAVLLVLLAGCDAFGLFDDDGQEDRYPVHVHTWGDEAYFEAMRSDIEAAVNRWSRVLAPTPAEPYVWAYDTPCFASNGGLDRAPLRDLGPIESIPGAHVYGFAKGDTLPAGFHVIIRREKLPELFRAGEYRNICATPDPAKGVVRAFHPRLGTPVIGLVALNSRAVNLRPMSTEDLLVHEIGHGLGANHENWYPRFRLVREWPGGGRGVLLFPQVIASLNIPAGEPQPVGIPSQYEDGKGVIHLAPECVPEIMANAWPLGGERTVITELTAGMLYDGFSYNPRALDKSIAWSDTASGWGRAPLGCLVSAANITLVEK